MNILPKVCSTTFRSKFNYPRECSTTLGDLFNYPRECSTNLGDMFNYPRGYVQLLSGVCSTTLRNMSNYPRGGIFKYPRILGNIIKSKCFARCCLKKIRKTSSENAGEVFARRFFDFFWDASRETPTFETIFGRPWSETGLKSKRFVLYDAVWESAVSSQK